MNYQRQTAPYSCCQLVAAFNALIFYGKKAPSQRGKRFERLVDLTYCRSGSALAVYRAHYELGLKTRTIGKTLASVRYHLDKGRPVELGIYREWAGQHAVLLVGRRYGEYLITNWCPKENVSQVSARLLREALRLNHVRDWCYFTLDEPRPRAYRPCVVEDCVSLTLEGELCSYCLRRKPK